MTMYGANLEQLANLGASPSRQIESINQVMSTVDGVINGTTWQGPAATGSLTIGTPHSKAR